jgi:hypothetical protein
MTVKKQTARPSAPPKAAKAKARTDWEAVERDYRTGTFTLRELGSRHGTNHTTVSRRADKQGWTKDLTEAIRQATNAKLIEATVQQECTGAHQAATNAVLGAAELNKQVILGHRSRVARAVDVSMRMLAELDATTSKAGEIEALFEVLTEDMDERGKAAAQQQLREFMRLHSRVGSVHKLMDALGKAQALERIAFNIGDGGDGGDKPKPSAKSVYDLTDEELMAEIMADRRAKAA